jgi:hypothetical protein
MRRQCAIATVVAAVLLAGCGGGDKDPSVTVSLQGGRGNENATACGKQEPFERYRTSDDVRYAGKVDPAPKGRWKAKIKIKKCSGADFVETSSQKIVGQPGGAFSGAFRDLGPGAYYLRARYQGGGQPESDKLYFQVSR